MTITITTTKQIEVSAPVYRKNGESYYRIDEKWCIKAQVWPAPAIQAFSNDLASPWMENSEDIPELLFYSVYAAANNELNIAANVITHQLNHPE